MQLEITTPDKTIFSGKAYLIQLPGEDGSFELMDKHAPLVGVLKKGKIKVLDRQGAEPIFIDIDGGAVEVHDNVVVVLADVKH